MHRYLLFDSGCSTCTQVARTIEDETEGWLTARSLREPEVQELLDRAQPDWRWEPALLEVDGEDVRAYTGLRMRWRLLRGLGPRRAWRVAQLVREAGGSVMSGVDLGRRSLLRRGGALLAGLALLPGMSKPHTEPPAGGPRRGGSHPFLDLEVRTSVRLEGEAAEAFRLKALASPDVGHIQAVQAFTDAGPT